LEGDGGGVEARGKTGPLQIVSIYVLVAGKILRLLRNFEEPSQAWMSECCAGIIVNVHWIGWLSELNAL
jgi:hypothetical protein